MTDVHECENDCGRPAPHTYVCWECIDHHTDLLHDFTATGALVAIYRRQARPATRNIPTSTTTTGAGQDAINLNIFTLYTNLTAHWPATLPTLPHNPDAAHQLARLRNDIERATTLIHGEPERTVTDEHLQARMDEIRPMQTHQLVPWMEEHLGLHISPERIKKWHQRGQLHPRLAPPGKWPYYHPADILHTLAGK